MLSNKKFIQTKIQLDKDDVINKRKVLMKQKEDLETQVKEKDQNEYNLLNKKEELMNEVGRLSYFYILKRFYLKNKISNLDKQIFNVINEKHFLKKSLKDLKLNIEQLNFQIIQLNNKLTKEKRIEILTQLITQSFVYLVDFFCQSIFNKSFGELKSLVLSNVISYIFFFFK